MRIGYHLDTHASPYHRPVVDRDEVARGLDAMVEEALAAERAGFHSIQVPDRHGRAELFPGALQLLTILARETERVAIGSCALVLTAYDPMHVAAECAVIDNLSRGRLYMTLGRGWNPVDWSYFGIPQLRLLGRFLEGLAVLREANLGERFSHQGEFFRVDDALLTPRPYQEGGYPIWGGGMLTPAIRRAAEIGECWVCAPFPLLEETWEEQAGAYRRRAQELGKQPFIVLMRDGWVGVDDESTVKEWAVNYVEEMKIMLGGGILAHHPAFDSEASLTLESVREHVVVGSAQECIERLERYERELGIDYVSMRFRTATGPPFEPVKEQIARFGEEVVGYFNRRDPAPEHPAIPAGARW